MPVLNNMSIELSKEDIDLIIEAMVYGAAFQRVFFEDGQIKTEKIEYKKAIKLLEK